MFLEAIWALTCFNISRSQFSSSAKVDSDEFTLEMKDNITTLFFNNIESLKNSKPWNTGALILNQFRGYLYQEEKSLSSPTL
jgi:hypothetical protein